jgi:hypothetical protein
VGLFFYKKRLWASAPHDGIGRFPPNLTGRRTPPLCLKKRRRINVSLTLQAHAASAHGDGLALSGKTLPPPGSESMDMRIRNPSEGMPVGRPARAQPAMQRGA